MWMGALLHAHAHFFTLDPRPYQSQQRSKNTFSSSFCLLFDIFLAFLSIHLKKKYERRHLILGTTPRLTVAEYLILSCPNDPKMPTWQPHYFVVLCMCDAHYFQTLCRSLSTILFSLFNWFRIATIPLLTVGMLMTGVFSCQWDVSFGLFIPSCWAKLDLYGGVRWGVDSKEWYMIKDTTRR